MSTVNVRGSMDAAGAVGYVLYGHDHNRELELLENGRTRAAAFALSMADGGRTPVEFIERAELLARVHGRTNQLYTYVQAFHPDEFDVASQADMERIRDIAVKLTERMHSADYMVVVHSDSAGGHGHAHILVINHDNLTGNALRRFTSWTHGVHQLNDELMRDEGLGVLAAPGQPKPDWEVRRGDFADGGFEQNLGDRIHDALADSRAIDRTSYEQVLNERGITLAVTHRDGWSYKMRRTDNGKLGRKKASVLTPEFTAEGAQQIFDCRSPKRQTHSPLGHDQTDRRAPEDSKDIGSIDLDAPRRQAAAQQVGDGGRGLHHVPEDDGRSGRREAGPSVALPVPRGALDAPTLRRDEEHSEQDREDARQHRIDAPQLADRDVARRRRLDAIRSRLRHDDEEDRGRGRDDWSEFA